MPEYDNNPTEQPPLDYESWEIAFEAYQHYPVEALMLGANIMVLKAYLLIEPPRLAEAIEGLDAYEMFRRVAGGQLTFEEEEMLKALGLKF